MLDDKPTDTGTGDEWEHPLHRVYDTAERVSVNPEKLIKACGFSKKLREATADVYGLIGTGHIDDELVREFLDKVYGSIPTIIIVKKALELKQAKAKRRAARRDKAIVGGPDAKVTPLRRTAVRQPNCRTYSGYRSDK